MDEAGNPNSFTGLGLLETQHGGIEAHVIDSPGKESTATCYDSRGAVCQWFPGLPSN